MAGLDGERIAGVVAGRRVGAGATDNRVVAAEAGEHIVARTAVKLIMAARPREGDARRGVRLQQDVGLIVTGIDVSRMRERRGKMPAELIDLGEAVIKGGNRVTSDGATIGIDEDDAVVAVIRIDLRAGPAGHGVVGDGHPAGVAVEDDDAAGAAGRATIADVDDRVVIDGRVSAAEVAVGSKSAPNRASAASLVPLWRHSRKVGGGNNLNDVRFRG
jgi:hypothetical protein